MKDKELTQKYKISEGVEQKEGKLRGKIDIFL